MLVPMRAILDAADKNGYAQGAFNVNAVCQVKAAVDVHQILRSPAIIQELILQMDLWVDVQISLIPH